MYQFKLPDIGEGTHEAEIIQWHVAEGDEVKEDDILVEIESDKATAELPCPVDGVIVKRIGEEGKKAVVGSVILEIDTGDDTTADADAGGAGAEESAATDASAAADAAPGAGEAEKAEAADATAAEDAGAGSAGGERALVHDENVDIRTLAVPRVRHFAREKGIDLRTISGTGRSGLITMEDVEKALAGGGAAASAGASAGEAAAAPSEEKAQAAAASSGVDTVKRAAGVDAPAGAPAGKDGETGAVAQAPADAGAAGTPSYEFDDKGERREPMSAVRKTTARMLVQSRQQVPHVTILDRADVGALMEHRARLKPIAAERGIKLTYTPYIVKACVAMLKAQPDLNSYADMDAQEVVYRSTFHIGVAVNTDNGLFVPVVRNADRLSLFEIAQEIQRLIEAAQAGKLTKADMTGGSMTVTNVGGAAIGGVWSTPIINVPESVIVGIGRIEGEFMPDEENQPVLRPMMKLSYAFDHRLVDGVTAQYGLNALRTFLSDPDLLLAES